MEGRGSVGHEFFGLVAPALEAPLILQLAGAGLSGVNTHMVLRVEWPALGLAWRCLNFAMAGCAVPWHRWPWLQRYPLMRRTDAHVPGCTLADCKSRRAWLLQDAPWQILVGYHAMPRVWGRAAGTVHATSLKPLLPLPPSCSWRRVLNDYMLMKKEL